MVFYIQSYKDSLFPVALPLLNKGYMKAHKHWEISRFTAT